MNGSAPQRLALFDIDGTLVRAPSTEKRFALWLLLRGRIGLARLLAYAVFSLRYLPQYGLGVFAKNKSLLWRRTAASARSLAGAWASRHLRKALFAPCFKRLQAHLERGDIVVLLSGAPQFLAEAVAEELQVSTVLGTRCAERNGRFCLAPPALHRVGEEKLAAARALARQLGTRLSSASAYGNAISDLPLLAACGCPVAVNPDSKLAAEARRQGWRVMGAQAGGGSHAAV
ncbi:MAG: HAD-IB family phosphatase [Gammaproteobacteria bacterium]|nr:HAD-IB family phosphatase [Gammaproteobacteria bacterium]